MLRVGKNNKIKQKKLLKREENSNIYNNRSICNYLLVSVFLSFLFVAEIAKQKLLFKKNRFNFEFALNEIKKNKNSSVLCY